MIDIHCHILPGIDDGPADIDESVEMCRMAASDGVTVIVATPHFTPGQYMADSARVYEQASKLSAALRRLDIPIKIFAGADVAISPEVPAQLRSVGHLTINGAGRYFLAEFPHSHVTPNWEGFLLSIAASGITPVITHPERNLWLMNHPEALYPVVAKGVMVQITAMSLTGEFGEQAQEVSLYLLQHNLAHVIATDAHSATYRPPILSEAADMVAELFGREKADRLVKTTPAAIVEGRPVSLEEPIAPSGRKAGLF